MSNPWEDYGSNAAPWEDFGGASEETPKKKRGLPEGYSAKNVLPTEKETEDYLAQLRGLGEAGRSLVGGIVGAAGGFAGTVAGALEYGMGRESAAKREAAAAKGMETFSAPFQPTTEVGKRNVENIGTAINEVANPLLGHMPQIEGFLTAMGAARGLKQAAKPLKQAPKQALEQLPPEVPMTLDEAIAQAEKAPENQRVGPPTRSSMPWEDYAAPEAPAAGAKNLRQGELDFGNQPETVTVSPSGTAMTTPEQVAGYEQYGRRMEQPEAPPQAPLQGQGDLFMNEQVEGPIATPYNAAERGVLEAPTDNPALARRQMELQLENQNPIYVSQGRGPSTSYLNLNERYPVTLNNGSRITLERTAEGPERVVGGPGWQYNPDEVNQTIIARDESGNQIGRLDFMPGGQAIESWVDPAYRRQGIGTMLYDSAEAHGAIFKGTGEHLGTVSSDAQALRRARNQRGTSATAYLELPEKVRSITEEAQLVDFARKAAEDKQRALAAKQAVESGQTGDLFADYVNQHRDYELFRDENGRPLSRAAFDETIKNLEDEPRSVYTRPEDMNQAYAKYLENFNGVQAGLFDQPTTAKEMAATLRNDAIGRMTQNHPLVKAAEKYLNEQQQFLDQLKQQGANAEMIKDAARDVESATARLNKTLENVEKNLKGGPAARALPKGKEVYEGMGETIRRTGRLARRQGGGTTTDFLESVLSLGLNNKFSKKGLSSQRPEIIAGENRNQHLPQAVRKGLEDYTFERRSNEAIEADIVKNNIPDIGKSVLDKAQAGGLFKQLQTNNPIVRKTFAAVKEAHRNATANIRTFIQDPKEGLPALFRQLTKKEAGDWWAARQIAEGKEKLSPYQMEQMGMNEKQIAMNKRFDQVMDFVFDQINKTRELAGKGPVDKRIGYLAGQFTGDFSRTIYKLDEAGNKVIVGRVGSDVKAVMERRVQKVLEANPEWKADNVRVARKGRRESRQKAFEDAVEMLAENNPDTKALMDVYDAILKDDAYNYMNAKKHTMQKTGIFGSEGMKRDVDAWTNAKEGMASQIRYVEKMLNWAEMSKAVHEVKPLLTNEKINMPNAKAWSSDYIDRALGIQTSGIGHAIDGVIGEVGKAFGLGPSAIESGTGALKSLATKKLLGFGNPAFLAMQILQPMAVSPVLTSLLKSRGLEANLGIMTRGAMSFADIILGKSKTAFDREIFKEGHARNIFGSEIFEHHGALTKGSKLWQNISEIGIPQVEGATRGTVFTSVAKVLKENGYSGTKLFDIAENLTNQFMVDYSHVEAPSMYKELGAVGDMAVSLQRYKHSSLSTLAMLAREAKNNKQYRPLMTAITTQIAMGGLTGSLLFNEADWIYKKITGLMGKPDTLTRLVLDHTPTVLSHGAVSALTGMDMSKRFGMTLLPDSFTGAFLPGVNALSDPLISGAQALMNPTNETQWERFAKDVVPAGMKGLVEKKFFEKNNLAINPNKLEGTVERTTADRAAKYLGATGLEESKTKARLYQEQLVDKAYMDKRQAITNRVLDDLYQIDPSDTDAMRKYFREGNGAKLKQDFIDAEGNIDNLVKAVEKFRIAGKTTAMQRKQLAIESANPKQALRYKEMTQHE